MQAFDRCKKSEMLQNRPNVALYHFVNFLPKKTDVRLDVCFFDVAYILTICGLNDGLLMHNLSKTYKAPKQKPPRLH